MRIFERPYYAFNLDVSDVKFYNFDSLSSSLWYTIVTMSGVGYGDMIATTPIGRFISICCVILGAFLLSLMVAITTAWFRMDSLQMDAIHKMQKDKLAVECIRTSLQYNLAC